ncbi:VOC family protein [Enterococcus wangshanyuanii]|uniref:Glyoxalase n=1 Tax=Enterococcus wangshanyuanii TaxID=2005703 RepID=A0ABQ1NLH6_9ENTE|nr:VOC family protein [Enterococcus wangshanyuanii]GGC79461.1 glyoxalase [Enterococcus wangshanyuanii]
MTYNIHHIQIKVNDVKKAEPFYDQLFGLLGFDIQKKYSGYLEHADMEVIEYLSDTFDFGISSPKRTFAKEKVDARKPGSLQHIAFKAGSKEEVDEIFPKIQALGVKILHGKPKEYKERIAPGYYALFFESPDGIRFEIFHY